MALKYVVARRVFGFDKKKESNYVVKQVLADEVGFPELCKRVNQMCGIHRGVVKVVLEGMIDTMINDVQHGHSIRLGEFGTIRPSFRSKASDVEEAVGVHSIHKAHLVYTPGVALKEKMNKANVRKFIAPNLGKGVSPEPVQPVE